MSTLLIALAAAAPATVQDPAPARPLLLEAEAFDDLGGWVLDQQFMDLMGSPFLLAHGMGQPVADATREVEVEHPGPHRVWVRTRDWVAPWGAEGAPGRFQLLVDGEALETTLGTEGDPWHWQDGGVVELAARATVTLHDLTGFEGRCDAVLLHPDLDFEPPHGESPSKRSGRSGSGSPKSRRPAAASTSSWSAEAPRGPQPR